MKIITKQISSLEKIRSLSDIPPEDQQNLISLREEPLSIWFKFDITETAALFQALIQSLKNG